MNPRRAWILILLLATVVACGVEEPTTTPLAPATPDTTAPGEPNGQEIFSRTLLDGRPGCITCHSLEPDVVLVGESMARLVSRAEKASPGDPQEYIRKSIEVPDAEVAAGYSAGSMPQANLSAAEINALVDYLMRVGA